MKEQYVGRFGILAGEEIQKTISDLEKTVKGTVIREEDTVLISIDAGMISGEVKLRPDPFEHEGKKCLAVSIPLSEEYLSKIGTKDLDKIGERIYEEVSKIQGITGSAIFYATATDVSSDFSLLRKKTLTTAEDKAKGSEGTFKYK